MESSIICAVVENKFDKLLDNNDIVGKRAIFDEIQKKPETFLKNHLQVKDVDAIQAFAIYLSLDGTRYVQFIKYPKGEWEFLGMFAKKFDAIAVLLTSEVWFSKIKRNEETDKEQEFIQPSKDPNREEAVLIVTKIYDEALLKSGMDVSTKLLEIIRDDKGIIIAFGKDLVSSGDLPANGFDGFILDGMEKKEGGSFEKEPLSL